jgi:hypothetical protein
MARYIASVKTDGGFSKKTKVYKAESKPEAERMVCQDFNLKPYYLDKGEIAEGIKYIRFLDTARAIDNNND